MKKLVLAFALVLTGAFSQQSKASFLIDPYIGYKLAWDTQTGTTDPGNQSFELDYTRTGIMYGARAGYQFLGFMAGLEYGMGSGMTWDIAANTIFGNPDLETSYDASYMGVFVGYELPIMLRAWATYFFDANWEDEDGDKVELTAISLGLGFTGLPFVSLNAEYRLNTFEGQGTYDTNAELFFSASLPLNL